MGSVKRVVSAKKCVSAVQGHPRSLILLVRYSNLGPILNLSDILQVFCTHPYSTLIFEGVPVGPDRRCWGQSEQAPWDIRPWNYFRSIPTSYVITVSERHRQTTTCLLWHNRALRSIAGKTQISKQVLRKVYLQKSLACTAIVCLWRCFVTNKLTDTDVMTRT